MYPSQWGFQESPFRNCLDPRSFYQSPTHEEALARLHFLVERQRRLGLLLGPYGTGKSLVLEVFARQLRRGGCAVAKVNLLALEPLEMFWLLALELGLNPQPGQTLPELWRMVTDRVQENDYQQLKTVLLLDDADQASRAVLAQLTRLALVAPTPESRLTLVLAGRHEQMGRIGERLLAMADLRVDIQPWDQQETKNYLRTLLERAGCKAAVFDDPALARLEELSRGIPRQINQLADLALLVGAGQEVDEIGPELVESAFQELGVAQG